MNDLKGQLYTEKQVDDALVQLAREYGADSIINTRKQLIDFSVNRLLSGSKPMQKRIKEILNG